MDKELEKAIKIIETLIDTINVMPICWDEFVGIERSRKIVEFLAKYNPNRWAGWLEDEDE